MAHVGYDDTPFIPDSKWRVHDSRRPQPRIITPGEAGQPPSDAVVLFDGTDLSKWSGSDGDCQLHIEWAAPAEVVGDSQGRGNSGVFLMGRYEIQVLDGYDNPTYADGITAAIYGQYPPMVNACRKPGEWQTYDVFFIAHRFDGDKLVSPAYLTVVHNGVLVQLNREAMGPTGHKNAPSYSRALPDKGPLSLQDHGNPVRYRNIWIRAIEGYDER